MTLPIDTPPGITARLSLQRALLTHVTPCLRSVSFDLSTDLDLTIRFVYATSSTEAERELPAIVATEVCGDWPDPALVNEIVVIDDSKPPSELATVVFRRCEDEWVVNVDPA